MSLGSTAKGVDGACRGGKIRAPIHCTKLKIVSTLTYGKATARSKRFSFKCSMNVAPGVPIPHQVSGVYKSNEACFAIRKYCTFLKKSMIVLRGEMNRETLPYLIGETKLLMGELMLAQLFLC